MAVTSKKPKTNVVEDVMNKDTDAKQASQAASERPGDLTLIEKDGRVLIHEGVIAKLAGIAIREVDGVHALVPFGAGQTITSLVSRIGAVEEAKDLGIHVEVGQVEAAIDCRVVTDFGASIPKIAKEIRESLRTRIAEATGLKLKEVNIEVVDLYFPEAAQEAPKPPPAPRVR